MGVYFYSLGAKTVKIEDLTVGFFPFRFKYFGSREKEQGQREQRCRENGAINLEKIKYAIIDDKLTAGAIIYKLTGHSWVDCNKFPGEPYAFLDKRQNKWTYRFSGVLNARLSYFMLDTKFGENKVRLWVPGRVTEYFENGKQTSRYTLADASTVTKANDPEMFLGYINWERGGFDVRLTDGQERNASILGWPAPLEEQRAQWEAYVESQVADLNDACRHFRRLHEERQAAEAEAKRQRDEHKAALVKELADMERRKQELSRELCSL